MERDKPLILHPFLFALYPVLFLYSHNVSEVFLSYVISPLILILSASFVLFGIIKLKITDTNKAGICLSIFTILFFSFDFSMGLLKNLDMFGSYESRTNLLFFLYSILFTLSYFLLKNTKRNLTNTTRLLNIISLILVLIPTVNIMLYKAGGSTALKESIPLAKTTQRINISDLPDIYYIMLDEYPREDVLKEVYGFDNTKFLDSLEEKGFYIASKSRSNYALTYLSLASSLNMEYVNFLENNPGKQSDDRSIPYEMIKNNKVAKYLGSKGYTYINLRSSWGPTDDMDSDLEFGCSSYGQTNEFISVLIHTTALQPFTQLFFWRDIRKCRLYTFEKLKEIPTMEEPTFTFAHIMLPHPPYIFDDNGNSLKNVEFDLYCNMELWDETDKFIQQLIFLNKKILEAIDEIVANSQRMPIIIFQADHGSGVDLPVCVDDIHTIPVEKMNKRMAIFNAYYLPNGGDELLYDSITPVNTFKIIFNHYFDDNYTLLEDESYFSNVFYPYDFMIIKPEE